MTFGEQPAYLRVASDLREKIVKGALPPHTRLPSQARIREEYGVSDTVALEARKVLMAEGLVEGRSGSGTYVRARPVPRRIARSGYRPGIGASPFRQEQTAEGVRGTWESRSEQEEASAETAARLGIEPGERVMRTRYVFRDAGEPMMLSTSWEPLSVTGRTPVMLPEEGPLGGCGVVDRMAAIDVVVDNVTEEVGARPGLADELGDLGACRVTWSWSSCAPTTPHGRAVETADVVVPADRYRVAYHLPVK